MDAGFSPSVDRTFVVDDVVYAVSFTGISAHDLQTLAPAGTVAFPGFEGQ